MSKLSEYAKGLVALAGAALTVVQLVQADLADQAISLDEARGIWLAITTAVTAAGVYFVRNKPAA